MLKKLIMGSLFIGLIITYSHPRGANRFTVYAQEEADPQLVSHEITAQPQEESVSSVFVPEEADSQPVSQDITEQPRPQEFDPEQGNVSLDFRDVDIKNVLKILAFKSGMNIVAGPEVTGIVTIQLKDVPWKQALEIVLETYGYAHEQKGNIVSVTTIDNLKKRREDAQLLAEQEPLITELFAVNFAKAADIVSSIEKMKTERGNIDLDIRTNTVIITDTEKKIKFMAGVIKKLDATTPQVLIEAKILETVLSDSENFGIDWVTQVEMSGASRDTVWPFVSTSGAKKYLGAVDTPTSSSFGTLSFKQVKLIFEMLKSRTDTNILSNPRLVTLDNQPASIKVVREIRVKTGSITDKDGKTTDLREKWEIGVIFNVTPHVNSAGFITLDVEPQVSTSLQETVDGAAQTVKSTEEAKTSVMVKNGDTLLIAGLITSDVKDVNKRVPLLGDIPILGILFRKTEKTTTKKDLLIFITPHIITPELPDEQTVTTYR